MPTRRLEDRIREMCGRAVTAQNSELDAVFSELKAALREHAKRLGNVAGRKLTGNRTDQTPEGRSV
ncbi:MAG: hypothetical protein WA172_21050 [Terriglobales bacterium]